MVRIDSEDQTGWQTATGPGSVAGGSGPIWMADEGSGCTNPLAGTNKHWLDRRWGFGEGRLWRESRGGGRSYCTDRGEGPGGGGVTPRGRGPGGCAPWPGGGPLTRKEDYYKPNRKETAGIRPWCLLKLVCVGDPWTEGRGRVGSATPPPPGTGSAAWRRGQMRPPHFWSQPGGTSNSAAGGGPRRRRLVSKTAAGTRAGDRRRVDGQQTTDDGRRQPGELRKRMRHKIDGG